MIGSNEKNYYESLVNAGIAPKETLEQLWKEAEIKKIPFSQMIKESGLINEHEMIELLSKKHNIPIVSLKNVDIDRQIIEKIPVRLTTYYKFFPMKLVNRKLTVAVSRLLDVGLLDEMRLNLGFDIDYVFAVSSDIEEMIKRNYGLAADTVDKIIAQNAGDKTSQVSDRSVQVEDIEKLAETASVVQLVNKIILEAYQKRASDIHIEPFRDEVRIRYRIDGILHEARVPPELKKFNLPILSRIKIMANLNIVERRLPQDGKARVKTQNQNLDLRISSIPTPFGESMVVRILPSQMILNLDQLGFESDHLELFKNLIKAPHGIIFVTGPTGSGKSTTLYSGLGIINKVVRKVITIEDPIEYEISGITQIQVMPEIGLTFAVGLRSVLRHDPDVMMVGEVRDLETADIAIRVALTGHLILSTLHTNDAASGVTRLLDIGVQPYLIASSVNAFIAQRLVRVICPHCKEEDQEALAEVKQIIMKDLALSSENQVKIYKGRGCDECNKTGYRGRIAIHEVMLINEKIRRLIITKSSSEEIKQKARKFGMRTLRQDGWLKVIQGITTPEEVLEATPVDEKTEENIEPIVQEPMTRDLTEKPETEYQERRKYVRANVNLKMAYRPLVLSDRRLPTESSVQDWVKTSVADNISASGIAFYSRDQFNPGDVLEFTIELPDGESAVQCIGRALRVTKSIEIETAKQGFKHFVAFTFLAINSTDRLRIEKFCTKENESL